MFKSKASITALMMILAGSVGASDFSIRVQGPEAQASPLAFPASSQTPAAASSSSALDVAPAGASASSAGAQDGQSQVQDTAMIGAAMSAVVNATVAASSMSGAAARDAATDNVQESTEESGGDLIATWPLQGSFEDAVLECYQSLCSQRSLGAYVPTSHAEAAESLKDYSFTSEGLNLVFDEEKVDQNIKSRGGTVFTGLEDPILVWMTSLQDGRNVLVSGENLTPYAKQLIEAAQEDYNYRLMFPLLDLEDVQKVSPNTVLSHNDQVLSQAAARYGSDYFLTLVVSESDGLGSVKWNLYTADAGRISGSEISGVSEELASLAAGDIARSLAALDAREKGLDSKDQGALLVSHRNVFELGAGDGFVRVKIDNVQSLSDLRAMRRAIISYGYSSDVRIGGSDEGGLIVEIPTSSDPAILDGTMARAGNFTKLGPWHYALNNGTRQTPSRVIMGPPSPGRPDASIQSAPRAPAGSEDAEESL